jgi:hypothetical protein
MIQATTNKRCLSWILALVIVISLFSGLTISASAAGAGYTPNGTMTTLAATPSLGVSGTYWTMIAQKTAGLTFSNAELALFVYAGGGQTFTRASSNTQIVLV